MTFVGVEKLSKDECAWKHCLFYITVPEQKCYEMWSKQRNQSESPKKFHVIIPETELEFCYVSDMQAITDSQHCNKPNMNERV